MPDKKKDSKRKTEEIRVDTSESHIHHNSKNSSAGVQHIYKPTTFKFVKSLEYTGISKEQINTKSVQLEVCITQKYSKRSFLIGLYHMPLKSAVRKIVKDKYPLIPCMNHTIPSNMKVYSASQLDITTPLPVFYSNPNSRNSISDFSECSDRAVSDPDLQFVDSPRSRLSKLSPSVSVRFDDKDEYTTHKTDMTAFSSPTSSAFSKVSPTSLPKTSSPKKSKPPADTSVNFSNLNLTEETQPASRPETPTWDFYDFDMEVVDIAIDDLSPQGETPIYLPMETTMDIKGSRSHSQRSKGQSKHKKGKNSTQTEVPVIVITSDDPSPETKLHLDPVTPRNVSISLNESSSDISSTSINMGGHGNIEVLADVHVNAMQRLDSDTSIVEIQDSDSFIINLEEDEDDNFKYDDLDVSSSSLYRPSIKPSIPMQVFIDENYDSSDDFSATPRSVLSRAEV